MDFYNYRTATAAVKNGGQDYDKEDRSEWKKVRTSAFTGRAGLVYIPVETLSLYADVYKRQEYKYNMKHETYTYGAELKYMIHKSAYLAADFYSDNFTSRYDSIWKPGEKPLGEETRKRVRYYNGSLKGIFKIGQSQKFSIGLEYVKENLMSVSDKLKGENMYTMAVFAQDEIRLFRNFQAVVGVRYVYNEYFKNYATPNVALRYKWKEMCIRDRNNFVRTNDERMINRFFY